jgi:hypothetical protein
LVGRSHTAFNRWLKDPRWTFGPGPWKASAVVAIKEWIRQELNEQPGADDNAGAGGVEGLSLKTKADVQLKITRNKLLQHEYELRTAKVHLIEQCQRERLRAVLEVRQGILGLADSACRSIRTARRSSAAAAWSCSAASPPGWALPRT